MSLEPVFRVEFALDEPVPTVTNSSGSSILVNVTQGSGWSLQPDKFPFDVEFEHGHDDITTSSDGKYSNLDCVIYGKTKGSQGRFILTYDGVLRVEGVVADIIGQKADDMDFDDGYITANMKFKLDEQAEKELGWTKHYNLLGKGKFYRQGGNDGRLWISYKVYALV